MVALVQLSHSRLIYPSSEVTTEKGDMMASNAD